MAGLSGFFLLRDTLTPLIDGVDILAAGKEIAEDIAKEVQAYAKENAPWEDRTGAARAGLTSDVYENDAVIVLQLYHTVDYGVWLETIQAGAYAIIMPTLEHFSGEVMDRLHATETGTEDGGFV